ncbi:hypothetical protein Anapl_00518 [Anas platyrhynchos]|uniref:Uncharacterized protein n=1 Tax=Anas platyrhynchos TaxID=8839 RepID=R0LKJ8_ANAPL|nr:hypothetical protein Anapl_00518 [Anas platyrhynchos]
MREPSQSKHHQSDTKGQNLSRWSITASDLRAGATHGIYLPLVQWGNFQRYWDKSETVPCEASSAINKVPLQHQPPSPSFIFSLQTFSQHVLRALEFKSRAAARWTTRLLLLLLQSCKQGGHCERDPALNASPRLPQQWLWLTSNLTRLASQPCCQAALPSSTKVQRIHARSVSSLSYTSSAGLSTLGTSNKTPNSCVTYGEAQNGCELNSTKEDFMKSGL